MSLPASVVQVPVVSGYVYRDAAGSVPAGARVVFLARTKSVVVDGATVTLPAKLVAEVTAAGALPADFTLQTAGDGVYYDVLEDFPGGRAKFTLLVLTTDTEINLATAAPVTPPADEDTETAQAAAANASASAVAASASAAEAAASAASIEGDVAASAASALAAGNSATAASNSATAAAGSATTAGTHATNAATSAGTASDAATAAGQSATAAAALIAGTSLLRHGSGAPLDVVGNDGDYYLDDDLPKTLYGPKAAGAWPAGVSLQGEQGIAGPTGRVPVVQSVASAATVTPTFADDLVKVTAQAAALALANPTGTPVPGLGVVIRIKDNGVARAITYGTQYRAIAVALPTTTVVGKTTYLAMVYNSDDAKWDVIAAGTQA